MRILPFSMQFNPVFAGFGVIKATGRPRTGSFTELRIQRFFGGSASATTGLLFSHIVRHRILPRLLRVRHGLLVQQP